VSSLPGGYVAMGGTESMGMDLLPPLVTWLWLVALTAVLVLHCGHFVRMGGQHRWFHASHVLMLVSMLYMYASMEFKWTWLSASLQAVIFSMTTVAIAGWMVYRLVQRRPFSFLWALALIMQAAMIYMWLPNWAPALTWALVGYYGLEAVAWLGGLLDDTRWATAVAPPAPQSAGTAANVIVSPATGAVGVLNDPKLATTVTSDEHWVVSLYQGSLVARGSMAIMAASMGYMFAAMQLMR
jgi:prepilin signal peptidase PulO-like enzyme (type II secretory pathway)